MKMMFRGKNKKRLVLAAISFLLVTGMINFRFFSPAKQNTIVNVSHNTAELEVKGATTKKTDTILMKESAVLTNYKSGYVYLKIMAWVSVILVFTYGVYIIFKKQRLHTFRKRYLKDNKI